MSGAATGTIARREGVAWAGAAAVAVGVLAHLPMYLGGAGRGYRLAGMGLDAPMIAGMVLILAGLAATAYGLLPRRTGAAEEPASALRIRALDDAPLSRAHVGLLVVMALAVTIDVMKPTTLAFVLPGFGAEYDLRSPLNPDGGAPAALLPLAGISGTVLGALAWGWLADRVGRRASILLAGVLFTATSVCGAMPSYPLNLLMCFVMGLGVGGMLPIIFTLIAETMPSRHRGWLMVLIGGDLAGAYVLTSWASATLVPDYGWRALWLIGAPTGLLLILLARWIPESPRFLLAHGRRAEAQAVMARYGARAVPDELDQEPEPAPAAGGLGQLFRAPLGGLTALVVLLGLGVGLVTFGFQLWIPSNLRRLGFTEVDSSRILRDSALIGFPLNFGVAWLYGVWSARRTLVILAGLTAAALVAFALAGDRVADDRTLLHLLLVVPIWGISSVTAVLAAYGAEVYPTRVRGQAGGLAAGASKAGGVLVIGAAVAAVTAPTIATTALIGAVPMGLAALVALRYGVETRHRGLEDISAGPASAAGVPAR